METFTWSPRIAAQGTTDFRVLTAQFGDGYSQRVGDGLNTEVQKWNLEFTGTDTYISPIATFLRRHQGFKSFSWRPPLSAEGFYRVDSMQVTALGRNVYTLSATFQQVFKP